MGLTQKVSKNLRWTSVEIFSKSGSEDKKDEPFKRCIPITQDIPRSTNFDMGIDPPIAIDLLVTPGLGESVVCEKQF